MIPDHPPARSGGGSPWCRARGRHHDIIGVVLHARALKNRAIEAREVKEPAWSPLLISATKRRHGTAAPRRSYGAGGPDRIGWSSRLTTCSAKKMWTVSSSRRSLRAWGMSCKSQTTAPCTHTRYQPMRLAMLPPEPPDERVGGRW